MHADTCDCKVSLELLCQGRPVSGFSDVSPAQSTQSSEGLWIQEPLCPIPSHLHPISGYSAGCVCVCVCSYQLAEAPDVLLCRTTCVHAWALIILAVSWCRYWERWSWKACSAKVCPYPVISCGPCSSKLILRDCKCSLRPTRGVVPDCYEPGQN